MNHLPIGTERVQDGDRIYVKVARNRWIGKQRYVYEKYHKVKLTPNDFIVFLDGDKTNFNIDNLYKITRYEGAHLGNICAHSKSKDVRRVSIDIAKLMIKIKDCQKNITKKLQNW